MERITISLECALAREFDLFMRARHYANRSEAIRDILRRELKNNRTVHDDSVHCVANISYIFNPQEPGLAEKLTEMRRQARNVVVSSMDTQLCNDECMETVFACGVAYKVNAFAQALTTLRGVRQCVLNLVSVRVDVSNPLHLHGRADIRLHR